MYWNSELNLNSAKTYLDSSEIYLNLRKRMIKFWNSNIDLLKFSEIFAEFQLISEFK